MHIDIITHSEEFRTNLPKNIVDLVKNEINSEKLATIDYVSFVNTKTLDDLQEFSISDAGLLAIAVYIGEDIHKTRLIDNIILQA